MIYIAEEEKDIVKYKVEINREELEKIQKEMIDKCSRIIHYQYQAEGIMSADYFKKNDIRNYTEILVGIKEYDDGPNTEIYLRDYDEYCHPLLAHYVDSLLKGDTSFLPEIITYKGNKLVPEEISEEISNIKQAMIEELNKPLLNINLDSLVERQNELRNLQEIEKKNKNQRSDMEYHKKVMSNIKLTEIERLDRKTVENVDNFYGQRLIKRKQTSHKN